MHIWELNSLLPGVDLTTYICLQNLSQKQCRACTARLTVLYNYQIVNVFTPTQIIQDLQFDTIIDCDLCSMDFVIFIIKYVKTSDDLFNSSR